MPSRKFSKPEQISLRFDSNDGLVAGVDEAGRGPLAGPVVAAAVILDDLKRIKGLNDSKQLTALRRERLFDEIRAHALAFCVAGLLGRPSKAAMLVLTCTVVLLFVRSASVCSTGEQVSCQRRNHGRTSANWHRYIIRRILPGWGLSGCLLAVDGSIVLRRDERFLARNGRNGGRCRGALFDGQRGLRTPMDASRAREKTTKNESPAVLIS